MGGDDMRIGLGFGAKGMLEGGYGERIGLRETSERSEQQETMKRERD
jgi:hypothetical protein